MKKTVKGLIVAASVAAVVGVGAVSFAQWAVTSDNDVEITGSTGVINTLGDLTVTPSTASGTVAEGGAITMNALFPVDQDKDGTAGTHLTYWEFKLESAVTGTQTVSYTLAGTLADATKGAAELYWTTDTPTSSTGAVEANKLSGTATPLTGVENGDTVYVYMVATGTDAMNTAISLTFEQA